MPLLLHIETSADVCSVALSRGLELLSLREAEGVFQHAARITLLIQQCLKDAEQPMGQLDAVSVSSGPGSYTSLRVGTATAKGICYALDIPLIAVSTLQSLALACLQREREEGLYYPMIDARRMEVYTAGFDSTNEMIQPPQALIIDKNTFSQELSRGELIILCGNGAEKCRQVMPEKGLLYSPVLCSAAHLIPLSHQAYERAQFEDVAYYEPFYLKPPNITKPRKLL